MEPDNVLVAVRFPVVIYFLCLFSWQFTMKLWEEAEKFSTQCEN